YRDHQLVRRRRAVQLTERLVRRRLEDDRDLGRAQRQALAGAQVERHAGPAPVVGLDAPRGGGVGARVGGAALAGAVGGGPAAPASQPAVYCPRTASRAGSSGRTACSAFAFSSRTRFASKLAGGSIATRLSSCSAWFWITSRSAPARS